MATAEQEPTVEQVIGENVRRIRGERSQDEVARFARVYGLPWTQQVIGAVEAGSRRLDITETILLSGALGVGVLELLAGDDVVRLTENTTAHLNGVREMLSTWKTGDMRKTDPEVTATWGLRVDAGGSPSQEDLAAAQIAERRAATKLGVAPHDIAAAAHELWGQSMTKERDRRTADQAGDNVTPSSRQALRGRVTRQLLGELAARISEAK